MQHQDPKESSQTQALIKQLRERWKMTQSEISRLTNIPQPRLSRWESGDVPAGADDAFRLQALVKEKETSEGWDGIDRRTETRKQEATNG